MFTGDPGKGGLGFKNRRMPVPRGKMLGGSSGINYMVFVRGHPGDFDNWERLGADGWSYDDVLPCFKRMEEVSETNEAVISREVRGNAGPVGVVFVRRSSRLHGTSSRQPERPVFPKAIITAQVVTTSVALPHRCRPTPGTASARAPFMPTLKTMPNCGRT
ncbi:MAG: GMC family oxidoreductase N-terminal domain-containing protein [Sphingomonadales bacterium]|nr:GMC family oxidoreductase N-terminal domain-containing protein [Sphingomonadales bacterium]